MYRISSTTEGLSVWGRIMNVNGTVAEVIRSQGTVNDIIALTLILKYYWEFLVLL